MNKSTRKEVYEALDTELDYQIGMSAKAHDDGTDLTKGIYDVS